MSILPQLATSLGRRDEAPNQLLAQKIVRANDRRAVKELIANLDNAERGIPSDCIKVLYEIGEQKPELVSRYYQDFGKLLNSKNNRLVWGAMTALDAITVKEPMGIYGLLTTILSCADAGSVITRDHAVSILIKLCTSKQTADKCFSHLLKQLNSCPNNQFPMYVEESLPMITSETRTAFQRVLTNRVEQLVKASQRNRVKKVLKKLDTL
jgi:hypothetical protein